MLLETPLQLFFSSLARLFSVVQWDKNSCEEDHCKLAWIKFEMWKLSLEPPFWYWSLNENFKRQFNSQENNSKHSHIQQTQWPTATCMQNSSKVKFKFLGDKKGPTQSFYLEVWKIDSIFLYKVYLLKYQKCVYFSNFGA